MKQYLSATIWVLAMFTGILSVPYILGIHMSESGQVSENLWESSTAYIETYTQNAERTLLIARDDKEDEEEKNEKEKDEKGEETGGFDRIWDAGHFG